MHSPVPLPPWPLSVPPAPPAPFPSGTCYSCNAKSCGSQIRPVQGPGEELQPRAQLLIKKRLLNFSCCLGGLAAVRQCKGMGEDGDGHSIPGDGAGCSFAVPSFGDRTEPLLSLQAEWRTASVNISFFESFCSTGQHAFNASRETCTVMLTSREPRSQHWAVRAVLHREYDPTILPGGEQDGNSVGDPGVRTELEAWPRGSFPWAAPSEWLGRGKMTPELRFAPQ